MFQKRYQPSYIATYSGSSRSSTGYIIYTHVYSRLLISISRMWRERDSSQFRGRVTSSLLIRRLLNLALLADWPTSSLRTTTRQDDEIHRSVVGGKLVADGTCWGLWCPTILVSSHHLCCLFAVVGLLHCISWLYVSCVVSCIFAPSSCIEIEFEHLFLLACRYRQLPGPVHGQYVQQSDRPHHDGH